jgi:lipid A ethanolaminephosphotransferase
VPVRGLTEAHISYDETLLDNLERWFAAVDGPSVLYLHMMGSHGPAYFRRYPSALAKFQPDCQNTRFSHCTSEELINAYDNTIAYTDRFLAKLIGRLEAPGSGRSAAMIYMSDHGESLGEHNIYLHGMPYAIAPEEQRRIPFIVWAGKEFQRDSGLDVACLTRKRDAKLSHDNLFHSVLGLLDVETTRYDRALDVFDKCRRHPAL